MAVRYLSTAATTDIKATTATKNNIATMAMF